MLAWETNDELKDDPLAAARGMVNGFFFAVAMWSVIGLVAWRCM